VIKTKPNSVLEDFLQEEGMAPPESLAQALISRVYGDLKVIPSAVLARLLVIHTVSLAFVLYVCPQFGVGFTDSHTPLLHFFMRFGHEACAALCGVLLLGTSLLSAAFILKSQESLWLSKQMAWIPPLLALLTLLILLALGASADHYEFVLWAVGGILAAWLAFRGGRRGRAFFVRVLGSAGSP
jgi:hypothetical protein